MFVCGVACGVWCTVCGVLIAGVLLIQGAPLLLALLLALLPPLCLALLLVSFFLSFFFRYIFTEDDQVADHILATTTAGGVNVRRGEERRKGFNTGSKCRVLAVAVYVWYYSHIS